MTGEASFAAIMGTVSENRRILPDAGSEKETGWN